MRYFHLTTPQQNIWNLQKYYQDTAIGNLCGAVFYKEERNSSLLQQAIRMFIRNQSALRLRFVDGNEAKQYVSEEISENIQVMTFASTDEFDSYAEQFAKEPLGLVDRTMYRFVVFQIGKQSGILVVLSHLISDAWTFGLMANQVDAAYRMLAERTECTLMKADYTDCVQSEDEYLASDRFLKDEGYWKEKYNVIPEKTSVKLCPAASTFITAKRITRVLPLSLECKIEEYCSRYPVTQAVLFETALVIYLSRINQENSSVTIGVPVLNRRNAKEKCIAGMFVSTMPLTVPLNHEITVSDLSKQITRGHMDIFRHQKYPYSAILKSLREKQNFQGNLYDVMISYQNAHTDTVADTKWYSNGYSEVPLIIHIDNRDGHESHTINVDYQTDVFRHEIEIEYIIDRLEYILEQIMEDSSRRVRDINIVPQKEWNKLVNEFNDTYVEYPKEKCVHELFSEQAKKTPDRTALVFEDRKFTYKELDEMSNSLAHFLREKGIKPNDIVPIIAKRSWHVIVAMLGVLKAGGAYMPIDPSYPADRVGYMLETAESGLTLCYGYTGKLSLQVINLEEVDYYGNINAVLNENKTEDLCYIIFTSGSTGKPKGVMITHRNVINYSNSNNNNVCHRIIKNQYESIVSVTNIIFDIFVTESLLPLLNGLTIFLADEDEVSSQSKLARLIEKRNIEVIQTTPTKMKSYILDKGNAGYLKHLKAIILGGEALKQDLCGELTDYTDAHIYNIYGPAETTVWSSNTEVTGNDITIGAPIANTQIYILGRDGNPLPVGVAGELCIAGDGVGKGYLNRPELTAEKFVPNPFSTEENHHGKTMYHTGDLARWRADGEIEYLGRIDTQVKIRGLRIELGEIESVMGGFKGIGLAAAADKRDENNRQYLVGYYTSETEIDEKKLRRHLSEKLPKYMVPNYFMRLENMPMTPSGKTDRKNLPVPYFAMQECGYVPPETEQEAALCHLLEEILHLERIGAEDDFFEYGGDSLSAIEYVAKARDLGIEIALQNVFDYPTVRRLCVFLNSGAKEKVHYESVDFEKYKDIFSGNIIDESFLPRKKALGNVLLTGATGFLGAHVLDRLMEEENGKIYCLIRSNKANDGRGRLREILKYYFGEKYEQEFNRRIIPIFGDIEQEGLSEQIPDNVCTVIHTAASVKHYGSYAYFYKINVEGTQHVIDYAKAVGARLIHISTLSVSGNSLADDFTIYRSDDEKHFYETSFYIGQPLDNVYIRSKFEAERRVFDAILEGLDAKVIRVGNLTNRTKDYKFQPNYKENAFLTRVKAIMEFGMFPDYLMPLYSEFSPVDLTAEGIVKIAQYADKQTIFHVNSNRPVYFTRFLEIVHSLGISMKVVDKDIFNQEQGKTIKNSKTEYIFEAFQNDMDEQGSLVYDSNIRIENDFTLWFLKLVGFEWNETDFEYIRGYIDYFRSIGYLEV